ncbi:MAG: epimerase [Candidatus Heimdallarchaeota archaeon]|nr:epimerase [Candidatus Heimdallarchaeota archaeon]
MSNNKIVDILIIGGTKFLGRALVESALSRGHKLTLFNRGKTNPDVFPDVERIQGDRDGEISNLGTKNWDVVIDTCGYVPRVVKSSAEYLKDKAKSYVFISSISVYTESTEMNRDENAEVIELEDKTTEDIMGSPDSYGGLKLLCEEEVTKTFNDSLIIRPGLIVGPHDPTNRFTYWPVRIRKGGKILIPKDENYPVQVIDVRDLADFTLDLIEKGVSGAFNATGPEYQLTLGAVFEICKSFSSNNPEFVTADNQWLLDNEVQPWMEMPLWIPDDTGRALMQVSIAKALKNDLQFRSLKETVRDTLDWYDQIDGDSEEWNAGMKPEKETDLLSKL